MKSFLSYLSLGIGAFAFIIYWFRPDWAVALTLFPAWIWLSAWLIAIPAFKRKVFLIVTVVWFAFGFFQVEEWTSLVRSIFPVQTHEDGIQITTVNASSSIEALRDAFIENPDIILIQESPRRQEIEDLIQDMDDYEYLFGYDTSIIVKGSIMADQSDRYYISGTATIGNKEYFIVSLRLLTNTPRIDLWKHDCWELHTHMRKRHLEQTREILELLPEEVTLVVGGDFNVPQGDKLFSLLSDRMVDSFSDGGRGWCNTIFADLPLYRIDQIWTSEDLTSYHAYARICSGTDHRVYTAKMTRSQ